MDDARIGDLLDAMTLEEQVAILSGEGFWNVPSNDRLGIGSLRVTDGPNGARGGGSLIGGVSAAAFPVGIALGSTWNPALAHDIGAALAAEVKSKNAHMALAPTVNIHRSVTNGRNFECYSEDPVLTGEIAVGYIKGLQDNGIAATIKHFVGNESEIERTTISSDVDERTLREVYLLPFEAAVKRAGTWGIMSSYNRLNGTFTAESHWLLTEVLRGDWGYDGIVMSDWFGSHSTAPTIDAGLDLEMPGPARDRGEKLVAAVRAGEVSADTVRTRAANMLRLMARVGSLDDHRPFAERADDRAETRALIRRAGAEGTVMLKNDGILPLPATGTLAVIGPNARVAQIMGGGSAQLNPHYAVSPWDGLAAAFGEAALSFAPGCTNHRWEPLLSGPVTVDFFANRDLAGPPAHTDTVPQAMAFWIPPLAGGKVNPAAFSARLSARFTAEDSGPHRFGLFSAGLSRLYVDGKLVANAWDGWTKGRTFFEEGCDEVVGEVALAKGQTIDIRIDFVTKPEGSLGFSAYRAGVGRPMGDREIAEAAAVAARADRAVLFVGRSGEWDTEGSDLDNITLPGRQDDLVAAVLKANPRTVVVLQTGGPVEMPWLDQAPAVLQSWYPGQEAGNAIADVLLGRAEPGGRLPQTFPRRWSDNPAHSQDPGVYPGQAGHVRYEEGVFIGYRHYDRYGIDPLFPFGHGLTWTSFALGDLTVAAEGDGAVARMRVTNTGTKPGTTVVQLYLGDPVASVPRPEKELKAFAKLTLAPGGSEEVTLRLDARAFAFFDAARGNWRVEAGRFVAKAGFSARDIRAEATIDMAEARLKP